MLKLVFDTDVFKIIQTFPVSLLNCSQLEIWDSDQLKTEWIPEMLSLKDFPQLVIVPTCLKQTHSHHHPQENKKQQKLRMLEKQQTIWGMRRECLACNNLYTSSIPCMQQALWPIQDH